MLQFHSYSTCNAGHEILKLAFMLQANFRHIDHGYNVKFGEMAKKAGVHCCSLLSSSGAHPRSYVNYLKVKGEVCKPCIY